MRKNMGIIDRILRVTIALAVFALYAAGQITATAAVILGILAIVFILTSVVGFCPLYKVLGLSTRKSMA